MAPFYPYVQTSHPITGDDDQPGRHLFALITEEFGVDLFQGEDGYILRWTDYVANEWSESLPTLGLALLRLAALEHCRATERFFAHDRVLFIQAGERVLGQLTE